MRLPRIRITVRRMMLVVLVVGLACGWLARLLHWRTPLEEARAQIEVTTDVMHGPATAWPTSHATSRGDFREASPGQVRWFRTYEGWRDSDGARLFDVEVSGGCDKTGLEPITIKDHGGTRNARLIGAMTRAYRERGWRYVIAPPAGARQSSRRIE
jgi:hypothetical protein